MNGLRLVTRRRGFVVGWKTLAGAGRHLVKALVSSPRDPANIQGPPTVAHPQCN